VCRKRELYFRDSNCVVSLTRPWQYKPIPNLPTKETCTCSFMFCRYLQEIGYTDTIIDVRSARIRQMLGLPSRDTGIETNTAVSGDYTTGKHMIEAQGNRYRFIAVLLQYNTGGPYQYYRTPANPVTA